MKKIAIAGLLAGLWLPAAAQGVKTIGVEQAVPFGAFSQWVGAFALPAAPAPSSVVTVPLARAASAALLDYQPLPVILGVPELPLLGSGAARAGKTWSGALNYQGVHLRQLVLAARGNQREQRPMGQPLKPGERFKIRVTTTFDAVAEVDQVTGEPWYGKRGGQLYPQAGMSVQIKAGSTVDLPLEPNEYFVMTRGADDRLVLSVRHAGAIGAARSSQPAYRQDGPDGSSYLQLVPAGKYPVIEQVLAQTR